MNKGGTLCWLPCMVEFVYQVEMLDNLKYSQELFDSIFIDVELDKVIPKTIVNDGSSIKHYASNNHGEVKAFDN